MASFLLPKPENSVYDRLGPLRPRPTSKLPCFSTSFTDSHAGVGEISPQFLGSSTAQIPVLATSSSKQPHQPAPAPSPSPHSPYVSGSINNTPRVAAIGERGSETRKIEVLANFGSTPQASLNSTSMSMITCPTDVGKPKLTFPPTPLRKPHDSLLGVERNFTPTLTGHYNGALSLPRTLVLQLAVAEMTRLFGEDFTTWLTPSKQTRLGMETEESTVEGEGEGDVTVYTALAWPLHSTAAVTPAVKMTSNGHGQSDWNREDNTIMTEDSDMFEGNVESSMMVACNESFRPSGNSASSTPRPRHVGNGPVYVGNGSFHMGNGSLHMGNASCNGSSQKRDISSLNESALAAMKNLEAAADLNSSADVPFPSPQEPYNVMNESVLDDMLNLSKELVNLQEETNFVDDRGPVNDIETVNPTTSKTSTTSSCPLPPTVFTEKEVLTDQRSVVRPEGEPFLRCSDSDADRNDVGVCVSAKKQRSDFMPAVDYGASSDSSESAQTDTGLPVAPKGGKKRSTLEESFSENWTHGLQHLVLKKSTAAAPSDSQSSSSSVSEGVKNVPTAVAFTPVSLMGYLNGSSQAKPAVSRSLPVLETLTSPANRVLSLADQYIPRPKDPQFLGLYNMRKARFTVMTELEGKSPAVALQCLGATTYEPAPRYNNPPMMRYSVAPSFDPPMMRYSVAPSFDPPMIRHTVAPSFDPPMARYSVAPSCF